MDAERSAMIRQAIALIYGIANGPRWGVLLPHAINSLQIMAGYKAGRREARAARSAKAVKGKTDVSGGTVA
jgi:hypothetical protein